MGEEDKEELENLRQEVVKAYQKFIEREWAEKREFIDMIRQGVQSRSVMEEGETFKTKVVEGNRVTIPEPDRELLGVEPGDLVQVSVRVLKKAKNEE